MDCLQLHNYLSMTVNCIEMYFILLRLKNNDVNDFLNFVRYCWQNNSACAKS